MAAAAKSQVRDPKRPIYWKSSLTNTILDVLKARPGWIECKNNNHDWDFFWCSREWMNNSFTQHSFKEQQKLTRKDLLAKNVKKLRRQYEKEGKKDEAARCNFIPSSYVLPTEYHMFVEEFRSHPQGTIWIMKPCAGAQGRGIFLFRKLKDVAEWKKQAPFVSDQVESYVAQKYIDNPCLVAGKKFDLRCYVLVTSFSPLKAWLHREGFARFSNTRYTMTSIDDAFVHLTNVAIQKTAPDYDPDKGVKWSLNSLRRYFLAMHGLDMVSNMVEQMNDIFVRSLQAVKALVIQDKHCFELYGYDLMLDSALFPYLIEVNASPSLSASSQEDFELKSRVLNDLLDVLDYEGKLDEGITNVGGFDKFWDNGPVNTPCADPISQQVFKPTLNTKLGCLS